MENRFDDALFIQQGACNPLGISKTLAETYTKARSDFDGTVSIQKDHAARMILHQLCHLAGIWTKCHDRLSHVASGGFNWDISRQYCIDNASERALETLGIKLTQRTPGVEGLIYDNVFHRAVELALLDEPEMSTFRFHHHYGEWMAKAATAMRTEAVDRVLG